MGQAAQAEGLDIDSVMDSVASGMDTAADDQDTGHEETSTPSKAIEKAAPDDDIPMPQSWKKEWEQDWKATPKTARERFIEREKQMLSGLEGYKTNASYGEKLRKAIEPYMDVLKAQGVDEVKAITYLLNAHKGLSDPRQSKTWLERVAKSYGVTMEQAAAAASAGAQTAPEVKAALERLDRLEGHLTEREQAEQAARKEATSKDVEAFASDPAHPYFDECSEDIVKLIGAGYSLKDAYEKAVWANPVTRQKELGRMQKEQAEEARKKALETARQAKKSSAPNVKGRDSARASTEPAGTLDETLRETLASIKTRT